MTNPIGALLAALATLLLEVMDKEPPLAQRAAVRCFELGRCSACAEAIVVRTNPYSLSWLCLVWRMSANYVILLSARRSLKRRDCCTLWCGMR
jgi:hypothetical protein